MGNLKDLTVAILTENGFEQIELTSPKEAMEHAGIIVHIVSPQKNEVIAWNKTNWGVTLPVNNEVANASADDYDGLVLPGGVLNPDKLRMSEPAIEFVKRFLEEGKPVGAICHGPQVLIETGLLEGRRMTSYPSVKTDLINAGAKWIDEEVVTDRGLVTSRRPGDLVAFNSKLLEELKESVHRRPAMRVG